MSITDGIRDSRFREIIVRPATGLGGQVLLRRRPHRVADYLHDPTISRMIREALPDSKIVIVTAFDSSGEIGDCLVAGADGCLLKDTSETDMAAAMRATVTGAPRSMRGSHSSSPATSRTGRPALVRPT
jgi:hypothetical protein